MAQIRAAASAEIPASPETVYSILADYRDGHPCILPKSAFDGVEVERGGTGAGTIIRVHTKAGGMKRTMRMEVTEPDPGHILVETDLDRGIITTFTVESVDGGRRASVEILTTWKPKGFMGLIERMVAPSMLERVYAEELQNLVHVARAREEGVVAVC
jgi:hypothetical protein